MLFIILFDRMTCYFMQLVGINSGNGFNIYIKKKKIRNQNTSNLIKSIHFTYESLNSKSKRVKKKKIFLYYKFVENIIFQKISISFKDANIINYILLK